MKPPYLIANMTSHKLRRVSWEERDEAARAARLADEREVVILEPNPEWRESVVGSIYYSDQPSRLPEERITDFLLLMLCRDQFGRGCDNRLHDDPFDGIIFEPDNDMLDALIREFERYQGKSLGFAWVYDLYIPVLSVQGEVVACRPLWMRSA